MADGHGGDHAVAVARAHGVETMFTLSGAHVFPMYDGAVKAEPPMRLLDVRHEQTAVFAAEATAKLTRTPGLAVLTAGPGVTNGVSAVTSAWFNGSPLLVVGGRAPAFRWGTGSLQELDHPPLLAPVTKRAATVETVGAIADEVDDALRLATAPHRGTGVPRRADGPVLQPRRRPASRSTGTRAARAGPGRRGPGRCAARRRRTPGAGHRLRRVGRRCRARGAPAGRDRRLPVITNGMGRGVAPRGPPAARHPGTQRRVRPGRPRGRRGHAAGLPAGLRHVRRQGRRAGGCGRAPRRLTGSARSARRARGVGGRRPLAGARRRAQGVGGQPAARRRTTAGRPGCRTRHAPPSTRTARCSTATPTRSTRCGSTAS